MAALISLPTPQVTALITIDQALVPCFPVAATRWLSSHRSAGNLEPNHRDRRCLRASIAVRRRLSGGNGYRFEDNLLDLSLPPVEAARCAGRHAGFEMHPQS